MELQAFLPLIATLLKQLLSPPVTNAATYPFPSLPPMPQHTSRLIVLLGTFSFPDFAHWPLLTLLASSDAAYSWLIVNF